jgi:phosphatidylglycerophosphatase A
MTKLILFIATGCYTGYLPIAPGTWGTLVAFPIHFFLIRFSPPVYFACLAALLILAISTAGSAEKIFDRKDPGAIVIDEIIGMLITLIGAPSHWLVMLAGFLLFRFFDIVKPFPVGWIDKKLNGGAGIVLDDCVAGLYALILLQIFCFFLPI